MNDMVTIKIDGKKIKARIAKNLLEVARQNSILIPSLCYFLQGVGPSQLIDISRITE